VAGRPDTISRDVFAFERAASEGGFCAIAGLDEAGRGALCGPVVAAAVILFKNQRIPGVDDSKQLTHLRRQRLYGEILQSARAVGIGLARAGEIDRINILEATRVAMGRAVGRLRAIPDYLLIDALRLPAVSIPQQAIIKGDCLSHSIAAASIIAKVTRDRIMAVWHRRYPQFGWDTNKGYGTERHLLALREFGPCPIHRKTFRGVCDCRGLFDSI